MKPRCAKILNSTPHLLSARLVECSRNKELDVILTLVCLSIEII